MIQFQILITSGLSAAGSRSRNILGARFFEENFCHAIMAKFNYFLFKSQVELSDWELTKNEGNRSRAVEVSQTL